MFVKPMFFEQVRFAAYGLRTVISTLELRWDSTNDYKPAKNEQVRFVHWQPSPVRALSKQQGCPGRLSGDLLWKDQKSL